MDIPFNCKSVQEIREALQNNDRALAVRKIQEYLDKQNNTPLNIAITGESGSGKSTFVNAFRGIDNDDERAAPTGCVETTMKVKGYPHPNYPNVTLWDLPGIGTPTFRADRYVKDVKFERFDFFIIISADRFRENDAKLALEIQKLGKKFYFVHSKIDHNLRDEERKRDFDAERTLARIRQHCIQSLQSHGFQSPQVFLLSSFDLHLYDFSLLHETLERELPAHQRHVLLLAMPNISLKIINKKKEAFQGQIKYCASASAVGAAVPVPGLSIAVDVALLVGAVTRYVFGFGLDILSLKRLAASTGVPFNNLMAVLISPLAGTEITYNLIMKLLLQCAGTALSMTVVEGSRLIPLIGIPAAVVISFVTISKALNSFLNMLADDAQRVFETALKKTSV